MPPRHGSRPDERRVGTEPRRAHLHAANELDSRVTVDFGLGGTKERFTEAERYRAADDGETKIEQSRHRRHGSTYVSAGLRNHFRRRLRRRPSSHLGDCRAGCDGLEASPRTALALPAVGHHVDVPDVACIA